VRAEAVANALAKQRKEASDAKEATAELARQEAIRAKAVEDIASAEKELYEDTSYKEYLARQESITAQALDLEQRLLGGVKRFDDLTRAAKKGDEEALTETKKAHARAEEFRLKAHDIAQAEYNDKVAADLAAEEQTRLDAALQVEQKKLSLQELYADYYLRTGQETFAQYTARIEAIIEKLKDVDTERKRQGAEPVFKGEVIRQELALFEKRAVQERELRDEAAKSEADRVSAARKVIQALNDQDAALDDIISTQESLATNALEMGEITESEYAKNIARIIQLMAQADRARQKYSQPPMFLEKTWALYEQLYRRQIDAAKELASLEDERFDDELEHLKKITGLREDLVGVEQDIRDRGFARQMAGVSLEYDDREDREAALAVIQREHAKAIVKDVTDGSITNIRDRLSQLDQAVDLLRSAGEAGQDVGRDLQAAYKLIDAAEAVRARAAKDSIRDAKEEEEQDKERFEAQRGELEKTADSLAALLSQRAKGSATQFFDEISSRIKDLGKVFLNEMGKVVGPAGAKGAVAGTGGITINVGGGIAGSADERDLMRRVRDMLTDELNNTRS